MYLYETFPYYSFFFFFASLPVCILSLLLFVCTVAAMIRGNHENCCEFATKRGLRVFLEQLEVPDITHHVLMVIQCLLTDSPEVLNLLSENDIGVIVHLLNTNGRNSEVGGDDGWRQ